MSLDNSRKVRVGEQIRRELSHLISRELKDPRVGMVTISDVEVSGDFAHAKVFYTILGQESASDDTQKGLERAAGFMRRQLGRELTIRRTPELHFVYDSTQEDAMRLDVLIQAARSRDSDDADEMGEPDNAPDESNLDQDRDIPQ